MGKRVLVVSAGAFHPTITARRLFKNILNGIEGIRFVYTSSIEDLGALNGGGYDAVCLYFHRKVISDNALGALKVFVSSGGGLFALHSASASFKEKKEYFYILGGRFVSHGKISRFTVNPADSTSEVFKGVGPFTVKDELYIHEYDRDVKVHFNTEVGGSTEPVLWTRGYGKGRVCYFSLGHVASIFKVKEVQEIIGKGVKWVLSA
ncbi:MAG: ThuA domain-containing protein [Deltaproteobacteria bacterium]|uniref:ThuA domain-containing protein n=1 Tax=Candidatus Zymogenus saltonus TaxID=2844893 RepID=A0A9D8PP32_9DELT|nr:ThuA domain-containing protein [Candidatus Zymogenus saltonus]